MSPEAPVPIFKEFRQEVKQGMSSNVEANLKSFGMEVEHIHNSEKIRKHRFIDDRYGQQLFRHDEGESVPVDPVLPAVSKTYDAVVVSDYDKGSITSETFRLLQSQLPPETPIFVDSKKKELDCFKGCIIKINESESKVATIGLTQDVIVTLGPNGARWRGRVFETDVVDVFDVCGAGDVFLASLVYGFLKHDNMTEAIRIANMCASLSVSKAGTYVLTEKDINDLCI